MKKIEEIGLTEYSKLIYSEVDSIKREEMMKIAKQYIRKNILGVTEMQQQHQKEVNNIINKIVNEYSKNGGGSARSDFTQGGCYYFAMMLDKIFGEDATIYITTSNGIHAITKVYEDYYDVNGIIKPTTENLEGYYAADEDEFNFFIDLCYIGRNKNNIEIFEKKCEDILNKILEERNNNLNTEDSISQKM